MTERQKDTLRIIICITAIIVSFASIALNIMTGKMTTKANEEYHRVMYDNRPVTDSTPYPVSTPRQSFTDIVAKPTYSPDSNIIYLPSISDTNMIWLRKSDSMYHLVPRKSIQP